MLGQAAVRWVTHEVIQGWLMRLEAAGISRTVMCEQHEGQQAGQVGIQQPFNLEPVHVGPPPPEVGGGRWQGVRQQAAPALVSLVAPKLEADGGGGLDTKAAHERVQQQVGERSHIQNRRPDRHDVVGRRRAERIPAQAPHGLALCAVQPERRLREAAVRGGQLERIIAAAHLDIPASAGVQRDQAAAPAVGAVGHRQQRQGYVAGHAVLGPAEHDGWSVGEGGT